MQSYYVGDVCRYNVASHPVSICQRKEEKKSIRLKGKTPCMFQCEIIEKKCQIYIVREK